MFRLKIILFDFYCTNHYRCFIQRTITAAIMRSLILISLTTLYMLPKSLSTIMHDHILWRITDKIIIVPYKPSDFGQIFTIFINIFIMMNWIQGFVWGLVRTMYKSNTYYIYSTLADWYILKGFKIRLFVTYLGQDISVQPKQPHLLLNLWMWDLIFLFPPNFESLTTSKLTDFSVFQKNTWKAYETTYYTSKL